MGEGEYRGQRTPVASWGYPATLPQGQAMVIPNELVGLVTDLIADPEAFMAAVAAEGNAPRLVPVTESEWLDPGEVAAVQRREGNHSCVHLRGGSRVHVPLAPERLFEVLAPPPETVTPPG